MDKIIIYMIKSEIQLPVPELQWLFSLTVVEVKAWMGNYIPHQTIDVITNPCPSLR